jgi:hypothetical protein
MVSLLVPWVFSQYKPIYHVGRYEIISLPPLAIFLAMVFEEIFNRKRAVKMVMVIAVTACLYQYFYNINGEQANYRWAIKKFLQMSSPGDVVIFTGLCRPGLTYYLRREGKIEEYKLVSFPKELERHPAWGTRRWFLKDTLKMVRDAREIKGEIEKLGDVSVWVFWRDPVIFKFFVRELKGEYSQVRIVNLGRKSFYRFVSQFKKKGYHGRESLDNKDNKG